MLLCESHKNELSISHFLFICNSKHRNLEKFLASPLLHVDQANKICNLHANSRSQPRNTSQCKAKYVSNGNSCAIIICESLFADALVTRKYESSRIERKHYEIALCCLPLRPPLPIDRSLHSHRIKFTFPIELFERRLRAHIATYSAGSSVSH